MTIPAGPRGSRDEKDRVHGFPQRLFSEEKDMLERRPVLRPHRLDPLVGLEVDEKFLFVNLVAMGKTLGSKMMS